MRIYGILDNGKNGREARKGSDSVLTLKLTEKGIPAFHIEFTGDKLTVQNAQSGAIVYEFNKSKTRKEGDKEKDCADCNKNYCVQHGVIPY